MTEIDRYYNLLLYQSSLVTNAFLGMVVIYAWSRRSFWSAGLRRFFWYLMVAFCAASLVSLFIWATQKHTFYFVFKPYLDAAKIEDTHFLAILAYLNDYTLLISYFYLVLSQQQWVKRFLVASSVVLVTLGLGDYLFYSGFRNYGFFNPTAAAVVGFVLPLVHFGVIAYSRAILPLQRNPYFWIATGLLVPNLFGLILRLAGDSIYGDNFVLYCQASIGKNIISCLGSILLIMAYRFSHLAKYFDWQITQGPTDYDKASSSFNPEH